MTLIDLLIIGVFLYVVFTCYRHTDTLRELGVYRSMLITIAGLGVIALFYIADFITMHLFPLLMPMDRAMQIMKDLHLNYMWVVSLVGVGLLVIGLSRLIRVMLPKIASVLQENLSVQEKLERLAGTDTLTNLPNRRLFYQQMERVVALAERSKEQMALLFLDLDGFKPVNDQLGHESGDQILIEVARRMTDELRHADSVARFGGDEFVVSLSGIKDREAASLVAQKLIDRLKPPYQLQGQEVEIGISIGICIYPDNGDSIDSLIRSADSAMYQAKQNGGNSSCVFDAARLDKS